jgi:WD40 repeat protein
VKVNRSSFVVPSFVRPYAALVAVATLTTACSGQERPPAPAENATRADAPGAVATGADATGAGVGVQATGMRSTRAPAGATGSEPRKMVLLERGDRVFRVLVKDRGRPLRVLMDFSGRPDMVSQFSVSPDGRRVAWIRTRGGLDQPGELLVLSAGREKVVARDAAAGFPCATPVWSPDSRRVAYLPLGANGVGSRVNEVDADRGGRARRLGTTRGVCHLAWSADGRRLAGYSGDTAAVFLLDAKTGRARRVPGIPMANHVQSLSPGGGRVVVDELRPDEPGGDGVWPTRFTPSIVDTRTGRRVPITVKGKVLGAAYLPDGRLAVRVGGKDHNTLVVSASRGKKLKRLAEPPQTVRMGLLALIP